MNQTIQFGKALYDYQARKISKKEYQLRKNKNCIKPKDGSLLRKANDISCSTGSVYLTLIDGSILVGKSLGFEFDYDTDGNQLTTNVLCFESFVSGGVYIFTEEEIENVA